MNSYKTVSYLTPETMNDILTECGYNLQTLRGGDFNKAKRMLIEVTEKHGFRSDTQKNRTLKDLEVCKDIVRLYTAFFNIMNVMNNPNERINKKRR